MNHPLASGLARVEAIASASKARRMLANPRKYVSAILWRKLVYRSRGRAKRATCTTFFGADMTVLLPSGTDIYLTGGKSHDSEIRLARYMIDALGPGDVVLDVGAHYGYFTLLASTLVGARGSVHAFEASPTTYGVLAENTTTASNVASYHLAASDEACALTFYEFPNLYSEYNTMFRDQFEGEAWFGDHAPRALEVEGVVLDDFLAARNVVPDFVKVDVEGAERKVLVGMRDLLAAHAPIVVIEYLCDARGNDEHRAAECLMTDLGYRGHVIDARGRLTRVDSPPDYLERAGLESDNVVFVKAG